MKIALVLRSGGDYNASDVQWLVNQLPKDYEIICLTDLKCLCTWRQSYPIDQPVAKVPWLVGENRVVPTGYNR